MSKFIQALQQNNALTTNGMATNHSSLDPCMDLFFVAGATRQWSEEMILRQFSLAFTADPELAVKILFWARDVRAGAGERRFFRIGLAYLAGLRGESLRELLPLVPEFGRWDDLFALASGRWQGEVLELIREGLLEKRDGLLAKWLPRKGPFANQVRRHLRLDPKAYRKLIVGLSKTVEQNMCGGHWDQTLYAQVPSQAMNRYRRAFLRHDPHRFQLYLKKVLEGKEKVNAGAIFPHQLYLKMKQALYEKGANFELEKMGINEQWKALPDYLAGTNERMLPVCDVSGSMEGLPMAVSVALGVYLSERNPSIFRDAFITFSKHPQLQHLQGDLWDRVLQLEQAEWGMNTDLEAVLRLVLNTAVRGNLPESEMPTKLLIISDMEFDQACTPKQRAIDMISRQYLRAGYRRPGIVFWNVNGRSGNVPVPAKLQRTALVSGFSPAILRSVLGGDGQSFTSRSVMLETVGAERYAPVVWE